MADTKISGLPSVLQQDIASTSDVLPIVNAGATKKATAYAVTYASLNASANATFAYAATPTVGARVGVQGTGTSWIFNTPSGNPSFASGLVVDGSYDGGTFQSEINLRAVGIFSGGPYGSELSLWTSLGTAMNRRVTVKNNGDMQVLAGNLVIGTSGKGIDFSATPGTGTSELLADYEEGTWTPSIANSFNNYTHTIQVGRYTKVGNLVTVEFTLAWTTTNAGALTFFIEGLPFTPVTLTNYASAGSLGVINNLTNTNQIVCQVESNSAQAKFYARVSGSAATALASSNWNTAGTANQVSGTITYQV
jgi:hypothetical protein